MKTALALVAFALFFAAALGNTIAVSPMRTLPKEVKGFANDLYAEVVAEKKLVQLFLDKGIATAELNEKEQEIDDDSSIQNPVEESPDGSETMKFLLHGCNGVFTDENDVVYFWRLSSPRVLRITSQNREFTYVVISKARMDLVHGM